MKLEVLQNINDGCITKQIRNHVLTPIYLYQLSPLEIEGTDEKLPHGKLLLSFVGSYLPTSMGGGIDLNKNNLAQLSKASLAREDLAVVHLITNALNINIAKIKAKQGAQKMTVNNEELEQPTPTSEPKAKAMEKKVADKVSYEFPKEFYDANHEVMNAYLDKKIKHTGKESKNKKTPGAGILTIPASDKKRFQTVMNLKKIKTKDYLKK